jgi:hypothetical protein
MNNTPSKSCLDETIRAAERATGSLASYILPTASSSTTFYISSTGPYVWSTRTNVNGTNAFQIFPTSPPLRLPVPIWENRTACLHSPPTTPSAMLSSPTWENTFSPTASYAPYSAAWSLRHRNDNRMIWQILVLYLSYYFLA